EWRFLRSGWLWVGVGISILVWLPNLIWQMQHRFISLEFLSYLHARDLRQGRYAGFLRDQLWLCVNLVTAPLTLLGLWFYLVHQGGSPLSVAWLDIRYHVPAVHIGPFALLLHGASVSYADCRWQRSPGKVARRIASWGVSLRVRPAMD